MIRNKMITKKIKACGLLGEKKRYYTHYYKGRHWWFVGELSVNIYFRKFSA
jgi:hypothetical protein